METPFEVRKLYKEETGSSPESDMEVEVELEIWRSKGQWILGISDEQKIEMFGHESFITIPRTGSDYIRWLEEKVLQMIKS